MYVSYVHTYICLYIKWMTTMIQEREGRNQNYVVIRYPHSDTIWMCSDRYQSLSSRETSWEWQHELTRTHLMQAEINSKNRHLLYCPRIQIWGLIQVWETEKPRFKQKPGRGRDYIPWELEIIFAVLYSCMHSGVQFIPENQDSTDEASWVDLILKAIIWISGILKAHVLSLTLTF